jgi:amidohydrolase domain-containing protein
MTEYSNGYLIFDNDIIQEIGSMTNYIADKADKWIDAKGGILLPGFINAHTHCGMIPFRSLGDDCPDRLRRFLFPLEKEVVDETLIELSTAYAIAEMQLAGITTMCDMYYFENVVADVAKNMNMRAFVGETIINQPTPDSTNTKESMAYTVDLIDKWQHDKLIHPIIAPHAPNTNTEQCLRNILELSKLYQVPITLHVSEMSYEMEYFREKYNQTPIEFLESIGFFEVPIVLAHCIMLTKNDIKILEKYPNVSVVHCIGANTKSAKGVAPIRSLLEHGVTVALGTDGPSSGNTLDIFTQMRMMANFQKTYLKDRAAFPAKEIVRLATFGGARALGLGHEIGSLKVGKKADLTLVETQSVNMFPIYDAYAALVYSANATNVRDVWVDGVSVVKDKKLTKFSVEKLQSDLKKHMKIFKLRATELEQSL